MIFINDDNKDRLQTTTIRISKVILNNFKNVENGEIDLNQNTESKASIIGIYGQNGSGKTSLINALSVLRFQLSGVQLPQHFEEYINVKSSYAYLEFHFTITYKDESVRRVIYSFKVGRKNNSWKNEMAVCVFDEKVQMSGFFEGKNTKMQTIIDLSLGDNYYPFGPASKRKYFINENNIYPLMGAKFVSKQNATSFLFDELYMDLLGQNKSDYYEVLEELAFFGSSRLFIVSTADYACVTSSNILPIYTNRFTFAGFNIDLFNEQYEDKDKNKILSILDLFKDNQTEYDEMANSMSLFLPIDFSLDGQMLLLKFDVERVKKVIDSISLVLESIVTNLKLSLLVKTETKDKNGNEAYFVDLVVVRNGVEIPFRYESDGIKKLVSILNLIIMAFNNPSVTVAIDEIDSGVFEYLLGNIFEAFKEGGRGQMIFTSHNLRPLEVISKENLYFTTTDPTNRYVHLKGIRKNINVRSAYIRCILGLEDAGEELYNGKNWEQILIAMRKAGSYE